MIKGWVQEVFYTAERKNIIVQEVGATISQAICTAIRSLIDKEVQGE